MSKIPTTEELAARLEKLSDAVTKGSRGMSEFTMRIPADPKRDADLVLDTAARRIRENSDRIAELEARELVAKLTRLLRHALPSIEAVNEQRHPNDPDQKWLMQEIEETLIKIDAPQPENDDE